ncbi:unnamed protein product, partial [Dicrocoelium dendriticum]
MLTTDYDFTTNCLIVHQHQLDSQWSPFWINHTCAHRRGIMGCLYFDQFAGYYKWLSHPVVHILRRCSGVDVPLQITYLYFLGRSQKSSNLWVL